MTTNSEPCALCHVDHHAPGAPQCKVIPARKQDEKRRGAGSESESDDKRKAREEHDRRRYGGWMP